MEEFEEILPLQQVTVDAELVVEGIIRRDHRQVGVQQAEGSLSQQLWPCPRWPCVRAR
ncbi:hypothetical protein [Streptomyces nigra]|uniref:hypothetical protein n=1 Tax=Streptomyces nigra TaxID=1827580 RepID=UPI0037FB6315